MANIQITLLLPEEFLTEIDTYVKEQNLRRAPYIKELLFSAWQNRDVLAMSSSSNSAMPKDVENQEPNRDVLSTIFDWLKNSGTRCEEALSKINTNIEESTSFSFHKVLLETIETSNRNLIEKLDTLIEHIQSQNTSTKVPDKSGIDILSKINNNLEKLSSSIIDDKSSKNSIVNLPEEVMDDSWEDEIPQDDCAQYVDKDGNLLTPEEYQKLKEEHDKYMEEFEQQQKLEKQAREIELRNQINPMPHYTHLETHKDENSIIYQETYKQYKLRYNSIRTANLQNTFELLNYMAPVLKTEKIYREFLEKIDAAESSKDNHLWQRAGKIHNYILQKHLESLAAAQAQYPVYQKLDLSNFIPYTIQEEKTSKKAIVWDV